MLRQACCHPQLSKHNQIGIQSDKPLPLSALYEVLLSKAEQVSTMLKCSLTLHIIHAWQKLFTLLISSSREVVRWAERRCQARHITSSLLHSFR